MRKRRGAEEMRMGERKRVLDKKETICSMWTTLCLHLPYVCCLIA